MRHYIGHGVQVETLLVLCCVTFVLFEGGGGPQSHWQTQSRRQAIDLRTCVDHLQGRLRLGGEGGHSTEMQVEHGMFGSDSLSRETEVRES